MPVSSVGVVLVDVKIALDLHLEVEQARGARTARACGRGSRRRSRSSALPVPSRVRRHGDVGLGGAAADARGAHGKPLLSVARLLAREGPEGHLGRREAGRYAPRTKPTMSFTAAIVSRGDGRGPVGAVGEDRVDVARVGE